MLMNEVCKECALTKKAVSYYIAQGLVSPAIQENGYRRFSKEDVSALKKISVLRQLGLSVGEIRSALSGRTDFVLKEVSGRKALQMEIQQERQKLLRELSATHDWDKMQEKLQQLSVKQTILERILQNFPGYYGRFLCLHFAEYLNEPVLTKAQQEAYETIVSFLDNVCFDIPDELQNYLETETAEFDETKLKSISADFKNALKNIESYMADNREILENYMIYRDSADWRASPACQLREALETFCSTSGYYDIFIPAMRRLSKSYREYQDMLKEADKKFLEKYPQYQENGRQAD